MLVNSLDGSNLTLCNRMKLWPGRKFSRFSFCVRQQLKFCVGPRGERGELFMHMSAFPIVKFESLSLQLIQIYILETWLLHINGWKGKRSLASDCVVPPSTQKEKRDLCIRCKVWSLPRRKHCEMKGFSCVDSESGSRKISMNMSKTFSQHSLFERTRQSKFPLQAARGKTLKRGEWGMEYLMYRQIINNETASKRQMHCRREKRKRLWKSKVGEVQKAPFKSMAALKETLPFCSTSSLLLENFCDFKSTGFYYWITFCSWSIFYGSVIRMSERRIM